MKKILSFALVLMLSLSLTVPTFAASDLAGTQLYPVGDWGNGPSLTLKGVTGERAVTAELSYCYDAAVGGSLVLDMNFPEGHNRYYGFRMTGVYLSSDGDSQMDGEDGLSVRRWDIPAEKMAYEFQEKDGKSQYIYNFTEDDMGQLDGYDKVIYMDIYWGDTLDGDQDYDGGSVYFYIRVVPEESAASSADIAYSTTQDITIDDKKVTFDTYALRDENGNDTNYIKLRDIASQLNETDAQFNVGWDGASGTISVDSGESYQLTGTEMNTPFSGNKAYEPSGSKLAVNGELVELAAIVLKDDSGNGYTYFKLRDLGEALNFNVSWVDGTGIVINTDEPYSDAN